jgi:hypothetical protein
MRYDCKYGLPHDFKIIHENPQVKWEVCQICNKKVKWNKGYRGRVANVEYLKAHIRQFAQKFGRTKQIYNKLYNPDKCIIHI